MPITVLVADDAEIMRRELRWFLKQIPAIKLVGEAADFAGLAQMVRDLRPQVVVMDLHLIPEKREESYQELKSCLDCGSRLLAVSFSNDEAATALAARLGAARLLDKMELYTELVPAITQLVPPSASA
jgi:DNA-binding NarL/FixJ family response regulator